MFVIGVYDVHTDRVTQIKKIFQKYLFRVQRSTFEGNLSKHQLEKLQHDLQQILHPKYDQVRLYITADENDLHTEVLGYKNEQDFDPFIF
ncbi:CRISPR-associated protein Cas2 [Thermoflavimicrobium dichotomicum]|uniref:CRISPR-associated endoribonuclease Cas2 n=2 Tax=Thermoflavimicrobium dichotomicum TaxID=46223 RepID=A0A1I3T772_9BACL|nr:CRISPR-associated protein Cas2 [Thermoflavimicrobium dichotomicum]